ncbi:hypothetical protein EOA13_30575 [Mesorhizobium sp. M7A.F.Ca.US.011.01.1.1]|nr:hypothetical protein EOA13_30575 [Mesorhizobium sp. M7A.F.Ca.US.011.01.1.1]
MKRHRRRRSPAARPRRRRTRRRRRPIARRCRPNVPAGDRRLDRRRPASSAWCRRSRSWPLSPGTGRACRW